VTHTDNLGSVLPFARALPGRSQVMSCLPSPLFLRSFGSLARASAVLCPSVRAVSHYSPPFDAFLPSVRAISHYAPSFRRVLEYDLRHVRRGESPTRLRTPWPSTAVVFTFPIRLSRTPLPRIRVQPGESYHQRWYFHSPMPPTGPSGAPGAWQGPTVLADFPYGRLF
jgi:hypothetical protein